MLVIAMFFIAHFAKKKKKYGGGFEIRMALSKLHFFFQCTDYSLPISRSLKSQTVKRENKIY